MNLNASPIQVPPHELVFSHRVNPRGAEFRRLVASIERRGMLHDANEPIAFVSYLGQRRLVNGHHRVWIARNLNLAFVPAVEVELPYQGYRTADDLFDWER